ncbi:MAG TPA: molybdopterin-dependent oxidoreductase [Caulobacteraceae bacterium]|jgi:hypothetical protein
MWRAAALGLGLVLAAGAAQADALPGAGCHVDDVVLGCPRAGPCPKPQTETEAVPVVVGPAGKSVCLTPEVLKDLDRAEAVMISHGASHTYEGVRLTEILRLVGAPTGARLHADADRDYLVVTGKDGFRAVYSLAETDGSVQRRPVILADHMDGAPLLPHDAPFRLVVDGDQKPARSVFGVTRIEVKVLP